MNRIVNIILIFMLCFVCWLAGVIMEAKHQENRIASPEIKALMKKHGIGVCMEYRGKYYFMRDGRRIPL